MTNRCQFVKLANGYHAGDGPLGRYKITRSKDRGWVIQHYPAATGGSTRSYWAPTLTKAKQLVAYRLGCSMPTRRK